MKELWGLLKSSYASNAPISAPPGVQGAFSTIRISKRRLVMLSFAVTLSFIVKYPEPHFIAPNSFARAVNRLYGWLTSLGLGPSYSYLLQLEGRKTRVVHSTPVNVLRHEQRLYLVGTRGHTQWSRNALVAKKAALKKGRIMMQFRLLEVSDAEKPEILKAYLIRFNWMVRRFFPISSDSPVSAFAAIAPQYPVFELLRE